MRPAPFGKGQNENKNVQLVEHSSHFRRHLWHRLAKRALFLIAWLSESSLKQPVIKMDEGGRDAKPTALRCHVGPPEMQLHNRNARGQLPRGADFQENARYCILCAKF